MKTVVIWSSYDDDVAFFILEGDYSNFDRFYIGAENNDEDMEGELLDLLYDDQGDYVGPDMTLKFPKLDEPHVVIVAGELG